MIRYLLPAVAAFVATTTQANACMPLPRPLDEVLLEIAAHGVMIQGTVIQAFDAERRQPEIIRAETIYIGEGDPREFAIDRPDRDYEIALGLHDGCALPSSDFIVSNAVDRLILLPSGTGKWRVYRGTVSLGNGQYSGMAEGRALESLVANAKRLGRFRLLPARDPRWRDL